MQQIVLLVRQLRSNSVFRLVMLMVLFTLMLLGIWVATKKIDLPKQLDVSDKLIHAMVFFGFAFLVDLSVTRKPFWLWKGLPLLSYGVGIEVLQSFTPVRSFSLMDMIADFAGILIYFLLKLTVLFIVKRNSEHSKIT